MAADVLAYRQQGAVGGEQSRRVQAAGARETLWAERNWAGSDVSVAVDTDVGSSPGECRLDNRTASREALPHTPQDEVV